MDLLERLTDLEKTPTARRYTADEYNLEGFREWLETLGRPYSGTAWIHVAGTKGKGSTAAIIEALLRAGGLQTGLFTSPHLTHYGQRFRFNGREWTLDEFRSALQELEPYIDERQARELSQTHTLRTVFEILTALAFLEFRRRKVDVGVLEVGLGGRLDCTNVVDPRVCVITAIGLDHIKILGNSIEKIAAEKAGIIKAGRPVVVFRPRNDDGRSARRVIEEHAERLGAPVFDPLEVRVARVNRTSQTVLFEWEGEETAAELLLLGEHQARNLGIALRAAELFRRDVPFPFDGERVRSGLESLSWPGRLEICPGAPPLVLDGAHCPLSARVLGQSLGELRDLVPLPFTLVWGMQVDKDHAGFLRALLESAPEGCLRKMVTYPIPGGRGAPAELLATVARETGLEALAESGPLEAVRRAVQVTRNGGSLLAAGTLYTLTAIQREHRMLIAAAPIAPGE